MKVKDIMTSLVHTCRPHDSLHEAARLLWDHDCGCLPVVDGDGRVQGVITDRDICMGAYTKGQDFLTLRVSDSMSIAPITCAPSDELDKAAQRMADREIRRLPVVDAEQRLVGILSLNDIVRAAKALASGDANASLALAVLSACSRHRDATVIPSVQPKAAPAPTAKQPQQQAQRVQGKI